MCKEKLIMCNDNVCEGDAAVDMLNTANKEIENLNDFIKENELTEAWQEWISHK